MQLFVKPAYLSLIASLILSLSINAQAESIVEDVKDMQKLEQESKTSDVPVLLLFSAEDCGYCEAIRENYLEPMLRTGEYKDSVLIRQLKIEDYNYLRNKSGELVGGDEIALRYNVEVTPTILFLGADGKELAQRIVGLSGVDYFDATLETHISQARSNFKN